MAQFPASQSGETLREALHRLARLSENYLILERSVVGDTYVRPHTFAALHQHLLGEVASTSFVERAWEPKLGEVVGTVSLPDIGQAVYIVWHPADVPAPLLPASIALPDAPTMPLWRAALAHVILDQRRASDPAATAPALLAVEQPV